MDLRALTLTVQAAALRSEMLHGREHLVAPVVLVREQVLNNGFLPAEEIKTSTPAWNGVPVTIGHPTVDGEPTIANQPDQYEKYAVGLIFNARYDEETTSLLGEAWLDKERAEALGGAASRAATALASHVDGDNAPVLEVSTSYWHQSRLVQGTHNNDAYEHEQFGLVPDHLAILVDEPGACSVEDGCGIPREDPAPTAVNVRDIIAEELSKVGLAGNVTDASGDAADVVFAANAAPDAPSVLSAHCCEECESDTDTDCGSKTATSDPSSDTMSDEYDIEALADSSPFTAEELEGFDPDRLDHIAANAADESEPVVDADDGEPEEPEVEAEEEDDSEPAEEPYVTRDQLEEILAAQRQETAEERERSSLIAKLTENFDWEADDLADFSLNALEKTLEREAEHAEAKRGSSPVVGVNYAGRGVVGSGSSSNESDPMDVLPRGYINRGDDE